MVFILWLMLAAGAQILRVTIAERAYGDYAACDGCLIQASLGSDAAFWIPWLLLAWAGNALDQVGLARAIRFVCALFLVYYLLDIYVMANFNTRMYIAWLVIIGSTPAPVLDHLSATFEWWRWVAAGGFLAALFWLAWKQPKRKPGRAGIAFVSAALLAAAAALLVSRPVYYVHGWVTGNVFDPRGSSTFATPYGERTRSDLAGDVAAGAECRDFSGDAQRRDLVILILESWSPYQSERMTGLNDWTPGLDELMSEHNDFSRLMANGYSTNHGLMSLLAGVPILATLVPTLERRVLQPGWGWAETFPKQMNRAGYQTIFLTSGDLSFTRKGDWLSHIGFEELEGHDHPFYDGMERLHFRAAPDSALYDRVQTFLSERTPTSEPLALVVETVSSHNPFIHPETRERDEEAVFRYLDETASAFIRSLSDSRFIREGGLLVVVSDHRAMKAISPGELRVLGHEAHARIPMMILGTDLPPMNTEALLAQSDIGPSLVALTTGSACGYPGWANLFDTDEDRRCVFHTRGDDRNLIETYCDAGHGTVRLAGDESRFISATGLSPERQQEILLEIARLRLVADAHDDAFFGSPE